MINGYTWNQYHLKINIGGQTQNVSITGPVLLTHDAGSEFAGLSLTSRIHSLMNFDIWGLQEEAKKAIYKEVLGFSQS